MNPETWTAVDSHFCDRIVPEDEALSAALRRSDAEGLPNINVAPNQGKLLHLFARMVGAKRILEIGTLGGYSTIWLARALPVGGSLITLEFEPKHAEVARENLRFAGLDPLVDVRIGPALDSLERLSREKPVPFDLVFIDADKENNPGYFEWALQLTRPGSVIIVDNVVRNRAVVDPSNQDPSTLGVRELLDRMSNEKRVTATALQTVGTKGYDGFAIAIVN